MLCKPSARPPFLGRGSGSQEGGRRFLVGGGSSPPPLQYSGLGSRAQGYLSSTLVAAGPQCEAVCTWEGGGCGQWYPAGPRCLKQRPSPLGLLTGHGWRRSLCADKFLPLKAFWPQEGVLALSCQFPLPFPSSARALLGTPSFFVCVMLPGEGRWSPQFLGLFLPPPWLGQLPEGPAPRIRLPSRRAETAICLLRSAEFSLSTPSPGPQPRPTPRPAPAEPGVSRAPGLFAFSRGRARAPRDCSWARRAIGVCWSPPQPREPFPGRTGLRRQSPGPGTASRGRPPLWDARHWSLRQQSATEGRALRAACCVARTPEGRPGTRDTGPGPGGNGTRTDRPLPASWSSHRPAPSGVGDPDLGPEPGRVPAAGRP